MEKQIKILSTKQLKESGIENAAFSGLQLQCLPFIKIVPESNDILRQQLNQLASQSLDVVFTSQNAIAAILPFLSHKPNWKVYCTAGATYEEVVRAWGAQVVVATGKNSKEVRDAILQQQKTKHVVFFCGDAHLQTIPEFLIKNGIEVDEIVVYAMQHLTHFLTENYDGILFFSPSAVHSFFAENTVDLGVIFFAIGKTTANAIRTYCTNKIITASFPSQESLIESVLSYQWQ